MNAIIFFAILGRILFLIMAILFGLGWLLGGGHTSAWQAAVLCGLISSAMPAKFSVSVP